MIQSVYYETWGSWKQPLDEVNNFNCINLAFANPAGKMLKPFSFEGTGLTFTQSFAEVQNAIDFQRERGVTIMLSVGGATYPFPEDFDAFEMVKLANALGCDGIDIDWEPFSGTTKAWPDIINSFQERSVAANGSCKKLSAAVWSTGCMQPREGDRFRGINIEGLVTHGTYLDWLNIMAYDSGPPSNVDPLGSFYTYRVYYKGPLVLGFQPGKMGWGGYVTTKTDVIKGCEYAASDGDQNGTFIWAYFKDDFIDGVTRDFIVEETRKAFSTKQEEGNDEGEVMANCECPWCGNKVKLVKGDTLM